MRPYKPAVILKARENLLVLKHKMKKTQANRTVKKMYLACQRLSNARRYVICQKLKRPILICPNMGVKENLSRFEEIR